MSRPKSYDRNEALERACQAFWAHGYQALGVREIEALTGLNQYAIRSEFGGKEGLYLEALKFYSDAAITTAMAPLKDGGLESVKNFLRNLITEGSATSSAWGCLIVNTGIENARIHSAQLDNAVNGYWETLEAHFRQALENSCEQGEVRDDTDVGTIAKSLVTAVMGVYAKNRATRSFDGGRDLVELICLHLETLRVKE